MAQTIINYYNSYVKFDEAVKFEELDEKTKQKSVLKITFDTLKKIEEIDGMFKECGDTMKSDYKLNAVVPKITDYKLRGALSIAQQFNLDDSVISKFLNYSIKEKPVPTLESYRDAIFKYCLSDDVKVKVFNTIFPHGVHDSSKGKEEKDLKGVDHIYLQGIGECFDKLLEECISSKSGVNEQKVIEII